MPVTGAAQRPTAVYIGRVAVRARQGQIALPPRPGKKWFGRFDPRFVEERRRMLEAYFAAAGFVV
eukprot:gene39724-10908_t